MGKDTFAIPQDENKWANSADLGLTLDYKLSDNLSLDFQVLNGEG